MIIDSLTHITHDGKWFDTSHKANLNLLIKEMDKSHVEKVVLSGLPILKNNEAVISAYQQFPEKIIPLAGVFFDEENKISDQIEKYKNQGFMGLKIHPRLSKISLNDSRINECLKLAAHNKLFVTLCTIYKSPAPSLGRSLSDVIHELCENNPQTKIILAHGGFDQILSVSEIIRPFPNVLLDLSATLLRFKETSIGLDLKFLIEKFDQRICVGSDFPEACFSEVVDTLKKMGITNHPILGDNLNRFIFNL